MGMNFNKILIVRLSAIGDVINTIPALVILRRNFPRSFIGWVVETKARDLLEPYLGNNYLNQIFILQRQSESKVAKAFGLIKELRQAEFDIAIDFQGNLKSGLVTSLSRAQTRVGMKPAKEANALFTNYKIHLPEHPINRVERNIYLLKQLGLNTGVLKWNEMPLPFTKEDEKCVSDILSKFQSSNSNHQMIVLHPGTSDFGAFKRWPAENYAQLADQLMERAGVSCVISWGGKEKELAQTIAAQMKHKPIIIDRALTLNQSAALYKSAVLFIGSDSAPLHLANLVGTQVIGLYGPKDPVIYAPYDANQPNRPIVIRKDLPCSPCNSRSCQRQIRPGGKRKCGQPLCMESITVAEVFQAAVSLIKK